MVAPANEAVKTCSYGAGCSKLAGFRIRTLATSEERYACGYHVGRVTREADAGDGVHTKVITS